MLRNLIRWARIIKAGSDTEQFAVQQMEYLGKIADGVIVFPYGVHANLPPDTLALMMSVQGNPDNRAAIGWTPKKRPLLKSGEVAFYHPLLPDLIIHLKEDGKMLVKSGVQIDVVAPEVVITGNLTVTGTTTLGATVTSNGKDISDTHTHVGSPTAPDGAQSNTGAPV